MFTAYIDESGIHKDSNVFVLAGYLAPEKEWTRFIPRWQAVLQKYGVSVFHASEFNSCTGEFEKFKDNKEGQTALAVELLKTISDRPRIIPFNTGIIIKDYDALLRPVLSPNPEHPYYISMKILLSQMAVAMNHIREYPTHERIACVFDRQTEFGKRAVELFNMALEDKGWQGQRRYCPGISFVAKHDYIPLQPADALAYESYREFDRRYHYPKRSPRPPYAALTKHILIKDLIWDDETIKDFMKRPDAFTAQS